MVKLAARQGIDQSEFRIHNLKYPTDHAFLSYKFKLS